MKLKAGTPESESSSLNSAHPSIPPLRNPTSTKRPAYRCSLPSLTGFS